jgi:hypothetical protein
MWERADGGHATALVRVDPGFRRDDDVLSSAGLVMRGPQTGCRFPRTALSFRRDDRASSSADFVIREPA